MNAFLPHIGFATVSLMVALSPGPSWAYTISTTLGHGRKAGMIGNLGNSTGILCHAMAVVFGLAALLQVSSTTFLTLKYLGAAYLVYLGVRSFMGGSRLNVAGRTAARNHWQIFRNGAFVSMFNPKISLLMLALLPQFVDPAGQRPEIQIGIMGAMHAVIAGIVHTHLVLFCGEIARRLRQSGGMQRALRRVAGAVFIAFGLRLALTD